MCNALAKKNIYTNSQIIFKLLKVFKIIKKPGAEIFYEFFMMLYLLILKIIKNFFPLEKQKITDLIKKLKYLKLLDTFIYEDINFSIIFKNEASHKIVCF